MIDQQFDVDKRPWAELVEWLRENCSSRGLTFNSISFNEVEIKRKGRRVLHIQFDPSARRQLVYELEDGPPRELQLVVTGEGQAYFRREEFTYFRTSDLGVKMLDECSLVPSS